MATLATGTTADAITNPYNLIDQAFATATRRGDDLTQPAIHAYLESAAHAFQHLFRDEATLAQIPTLSSATIKSGAMKPGTLVRYAGMVQDMFQPEWYLPVHMDTTFGTKRAAAAAYRESFTGGDYSSFVGQMQQRDGVYCVPIPGEAPWSRDRHDTTSTSTSSSSSGGGGGGGGGVKRSAGLRQATSDGEGEEEGVTAPRVKRAHNEEDGEGESYSTATGRTRGVGGGDGAIVSEVPDSASFSSPLPPVETPVIVRLYGDAHALRLCDMVEVVGIYTPGNTHTTTTSHGAGGATSTSTSTSASTATSADADGDDCMLGAFASGGEGESGFESIDPTLTPAMGATPRIQCIFFRPLAPTFPLLQPPLDSQVSVQVTVKETAPAVAAGGGDDEAGIADGSSESAPSAHDLQLLPFRTRGAQEPLIPPTALSSQLSDLARSTLVYKLQDEGCRKALASAAHLATPASTLVAEVRSEVTGHLSAALGGDALVAEWVLLSLLAQVHRRTHALALGKLSLNVQGFPESSDPSQEMEVSPCGRTLFSLLASLTARVVALPLSVPYLNETRLTPLKDVETERLLPGVLQLTTGTLLFVDATKLLPGTLRERGVLNLTNFQQLVNDQTLAYDFGGSTVSYPVDVNVLTISVSSPLVKLDSAIHLSSTATAALTTAAADGLSESEGARVTHIPEASLERCRAYLATVKALPYSLPKDVETLVCDELAAARTSDRSLTVEDLYRWMTTARLLTLSHGETQLSMPRWLQARELDTLRIATLALAAESKFGACGDTSTRVITS